MVLEQKAAAAFIADYKTLMLEVSTNGTRAEKRPVLEVLAEGRLKHRSDASLLPAARRRLRARNEIIDAEVINLEVVEGLAEEETEQSQPAEVIGAVAVRWDRPKVR